ncbi:putative zinc finger in N-recognin-domain-containing protein [Thelonectria olida]|uniref:Zinc finger in N-recognin-domain-containing protein n=1 Tax=Thelonectria olida TaxID=1576542 RepID=A0A9P9AVT5_9HYPO|nr:putative zinc finger in N-recognin-domain-containing protein [Thelonectria olida]
MSADADSSAPAPAAEQPAQSAPRRKDSFSAQSHTSENSQTAAEFIRSQEILEADAREALPYSIEHCTKILGPLRQAVFACLTCNPAPAKPGDEWTPAGVCYACSVQCHGEHTLVEIFQKRNFTCDCGTTRIPATSPCALRTNDKTNTRGGVHAEEPDVNNKYNHNFRNRFCGCECDYDPFQQKGTMFQCLGLGTQETGGCGEDWYHPGCLVGMGSNWFEKMEKKIVKAPEQPVDGTTQLATISEGNEGEEKPTDKPSENPTKEAAFMEAADYEEGEEEVPMPPGFPNEEAFEGFLCYKCVEANPWIKRYAGTSGFLPAVFLDGDNSGTQAEPEVEAHSTVPSSRKRKADNEDDENTETKRVKSESNVEANGTNEVAAAPSETDAPTKEDSIASKCKLPNLPPAPDGQFSLFFTEDFREKFCRCSSCYPSLNAHPQLLEEEEVYEPPMSENGASQHGGSTNGSGSLLERGESALRNVDRVRAIEGVMAYNHLKERLKPFFQQFAESGQAVGAEDIKAYFAKLRGDEQGIKEAGEAAASSSKDGEGEGDNRKEQSGY